jgi:hypothetical protein
MGSSLRVLVIEEAYSIFTSREKWFIVTLVAFGALFRCVRSTMEFSIFPLLMYISPLSANIYFPAIPTLAVAFDKSIELINLTVCF